MDLPLRLQDLTRAQIMETRATDYVRWLSCLSKTHGVTSASELFLERWPRGPGADAVRKSLDGLELKAAIPPGSSTGADWGAPLVGVQSLASGFAAIARSTALLGRIPGMRVVPFATKIPIETQGGSFAWIGEGGGKPVTQLSFNNGVTLAPLKATGIVVLTQEFAALTTAGTDAALRETLRAALVAFQDKSFLDPLSTAVPGVRPASITADLTPVASTGNLATDVQTLLDQFFGARPGATEPVLIANAQNAARLRALNPGFGLPIISTEAAGANVIAVDGPGVFIADGGLLIDISREAMVQMDSAPDSPATAATVYASLFQSNLIGYRIERFLNWTATPTSVAYLAG